MPLRLTGAGLYGSYRVDCPALAAFRRDLPSQFDTPAPLSFYPVVPTRSRLTTQRITSPLAVARRLPWPTGICPRHTDQSGQERPTLAMATNRPSSRLVSSDRRLIRTQRSPLRAKPCRQAYLCRARQAAPTCLTKPCDDPSSPDRLPSTSLLALVPSRRPSPWKFTPHRLACAPDDCSVPAD